jgi:hypothetical protein
MDRAVERLSGAGKRLCSVTRENGLEREQEIGRAECVTVPFEVRL